VIFWVALRKELLEQWRSYRFLIVGVVLLLFGLTSPLLARYTSELIKMAIPPGQGEAILALIPKPTIADAVDQYVKNLAQFGVLLALLMTMGTVAQEKDKGTAALMLVKPLPRSVFLGAKFVALAVTFGGSLIVAGAACYYYTYLLFGALDLSGWLALNALLLLFFLVYVALTLLCSTVTRSQIVAAGAAFGLVIVLSIVGVIPRLAGYLPSSLTNWGSRLAKGMAGSPEPGLWVSLGLILVSLLAAWLSLERQEL